MKEQTMEKMAEVLLGNLLDEVKENVDTKIESTMTSFDARLDGLKTMLNSKIGEIEDTLKENPLTINLGTIEEPKKEQVHNKFFEIINILKAQKRIQKNIMLVGEAGSGKTHLAYNISEALGLKFYPMSVGLQTTKSDLLGFINAHGEYVTSPVREAFEKGGILLLDEFDSTHAGVVTIINSLLANGHCSFPDKIVEKNPNFICIVACNTYGHGASIDYVGRNRLDGATLDRFIVVDVGYDSNLEKNLTRNDRWYEVIKSIRENITKQGIKMIVSPRASMNGADLLDAGFDIETVLNMVIFKGADKDVKTKCLEGVALDIKQKITVENEHTVKTSKSYVRDLSNKQVYQIRTDGENFDNIIRINTLNRMSDLGAERIDFKEFAIMVGVDWGWQITGDREIYFQSKSGTDEMALTNYQKEILGNAMKELDNLTPEEYKRVYHTNNVPIVFEFVNKGCRTPWKVIEIEELK